jgi:glycosyltransferase involved in cell wall biosynthesis
MSVLNLTPRKLGSFEEYTITLSRSLARRGGQSILVFTDPPPAALLPLYTDAGAILETKSFDPFGRESAYALRRLVRRHRPDVLHMHFVNLLSLDVVAAGLYPGVKAVFSEHASDTPKVRTFLRWRLLQLSKFIASTLVDQIIAPSNYVNARLVREGARAAKVITVNNGVNVARFRGADSSACVRAKYGIAPQRMIVVSISQVIPEKGIGDLIAAAAVVLAQGRDITFIHVGDGRYEAEYRERVKTLGIEKHFIFTGLLDLPEISAILRQSDVFTLPCTWGEAFSLAILEALAAGKPLIVTRAGGNVEAVEHGRNGLVVPPRDVQALSRAIMLLDDRPDQRTTMGQESAKGSEYFSVERWVDETIDVYSRLTRSKRRLWDGSSYSAAG